MAIGNIYYLIPGLKRPPLNFKEDIFRHPKQLAKRVWRNLWNRGEPIIGGIKVSYQHCEILNSLGYNAYPLIMGNLKLHDFGYSRETRTLAETGLKLRKNDIVVASEFCPYEGLLFENARKIVFVQNWINLSHNRRFKPEDDGRSYHQLGYDYVLACSSYIQNFVEQKMRLRPHLITNGIDLGKFRPRSNIRKENRVLYMPRKNKGDIESIKRILRDRKIEFVAVDKLTEDELIAEYQKSDIFLASGYPEGFGLPPLEAMACGCAVVGFTGRGANEFMIDGETAMVADDGDCESAAEKLCLLINDRQLKEKVRDGGLAIASRFSMDNMRNNIVEFYQFVEADCVQSK